MEINNLKDFSIKKRNPVVQCITNIVTVESCANVLHAIGAAPIMAHHEKEVYEVASHVDALVLNFGATENYEAMKIAMQSALEHGKPVVIDPVGVGGISFRREFFKELLQIGTPTCIRGNASEIIALVKECNTAAGVDVNPVDLESTGIEDLAKIASLLSEKVGCIVVMSGETDIICQGKAVLYVHDGTKMFTRITGSGCMSSAVIGGFLGMSDKKDYPQAVFEAVSLVGSCGKKAAEKTEKADAGIMTFRLNFMDEMSKFCL